MVHRLDVERIGHRDGERSLVDADGKYVVPAGELERNEVEGRRVDDVARRIEARVAELLREGSSRSDWEMYPRVQRICPSRSRVRLCSPNASLS